MSLPPDTRVMPMGDEAIAEAARLILAGQPVAVPTETVYGLAADATNAEAVARIYAAKGRPSFNPLIVHVPDFAAAMRIGRFDEQARSLAEEHWPGPLTLVVPLRDDAPVASIVTAGLTTIAFLDQTYFVLGLVGQWTATALAQRSAALKTLVMPGGLGSTHKVMIFGKDVGRPRLKGCSFSARVT